MEMYNKEQLLDLITKLYEHKDKYIIGQQLNRAEFNCYDIPRELELCREASGKIPALISFDIAYAAYYYPNELEKFAEWFIDYASKGGIISLCAHFRHPLKPSREDDPFNYRGHLGREQAWSDLIDPNTEIGAFWRKEIDVAAKFTKMLDDAGVPVLWRPFHEQNGSWFWFCAFQDNDYLIPKEYIDAAWRYFYNIFTVEYGMKNILWVYSPNIHNPEYIMHCYPGDDIVDVVAMDWYTAGGLEICKPDYGKLCYEKLIATGKPFALGEFGPAGDLVTNLDKDPEYKFNCADALETYKKVIESGISFSFVTLWSSWAKVKISLWNMGKADILMNDPNVYDIEKVKSFFETGMMD